MFTGLPGFDTWPHGNPNGEQQEEVGLVGVFSVPFGIVGVGSATGFREEVKPHPSFPSQEEHLPHNLQQGQPGRCEDHFLVILINNQVKPATYLINYQRIHTIPKKLQGRTTTTTTTPLLQSFLHLDILNRLRLTSAWIC